MTRDEFIDGYMERSKIPREYRTEDGFRFPDLPSRYAQHALPCACDAEECEGWAMIGEEMIEHHMMFNAPHQESESDD